MKERDGKEILYSSDLFPSDKILSGRKVFKPYAAAVQSLQLCLALRDPLDCSLLGSSVHGVL